MRFNPSKVYRGEENKAYFGLSMSEIRTNWIVFLLGAHLVIVSLSFSLDCSQLSVPRF